MVEDRIQKMLDNYPNVWKSKAAVMSWLRGGIRRALWKNSPAKLEFIKRNRIRIPNPNPNGRVAEVWGGICYITKKALPLSDLEVDHLEGNHSLKNLSDIQSFVESISLVTPDELGFISKEAHKIKTQAERKGISFNQALLDKNASDIIRTKRDKEWLSERGVAPASNAKGRKLQIIEVLSKEIGGDLFGK